MVSSLIVKKIVCIHIKIKNPPELPAAVPYSLIKKTNLHIRPTYMQIRFVI